MPARPNSLASWSFTRLPGSTTARLPHSCGTWTATCWRASRRTSSCRSWNSSSSSRTLQQRLVRRRTARSAACVSYTRISGSSSSTPGTSGPLMLKYGRSALCLGVERHAGQVMPHPDEDRFARLRGPTGRPGSTRRPFGRRRSREGRVSMAEPANHTMNAALAGPRSPRRAERPRQRQPHPRTTERLQWRFRDSRSPDVARSAA